MEEKKYPLRIALDAPEMEIMLTESEIKMIRECVFSSVKSEIITRAIHDSTMQIGGTAKVWIGFDDIDVEFPIIDYKY